MMMKVELDLSALEADPSTLRPDITSLCPVGSCYPYALQCVNVMQCPVLGGRPVSGNGEESRPSTAQERSLRY